MPEFALPTLHNLATDAPVVLRALVGALGAVVLVWGARIYRPALYMGSFGMGAIVGAAVLSGLSDTIPALGDSVVVLVVACIAGLALAAVAGLAHKIALLGVGAVSGVAAAAAIAEVVPSPWWVLAVGAVVGAIALPLLFEALLKISTPAVGAILIAWAVGSVHSMWIIGGLWLIGAVFQLGFLDTPEDDA